MNLCDPGDPVFGANFSSDSELLLDNY